MEECRQIVRESDFMVTLTYPRGNLGVNYNNRDAIGAAFSATVRPN